MKTSEEDSKQNRRRFLKTAALVGAGIVAGGAYVMAKAGADDQAGDTSADKESAPIPKRPLGRKPVMVSSLALGGAHLGAVATLSEAKRLVHEALDLGVSFMDNAWEYHGGKSEEWMGEGLKGHRERAFLMTKVCAHREDFSARAAMRQLEESLQRLKTHYLDLWQIHEVVEMDHPDRYFAPGGAIEALDKAREQGKARFVGFTGHKHPDIHLKMLSHGYPFDTCQLPLNCFDAHYRSFEARVLPELKRQGITPIAMKALNGNARPVRRGIVTAQEALRYALSLPVATVVSGIDKLEYLRQNARTAAASLPMTESEMQALRDRVARHAADGQLEPYKA